MKIETFITNFAATKIYKSYIPLKFNNTGRQNRTLPTEQEAHGSDVIVDSTRPSSSHDRQQSSFAVDNIVPRALAIIDPLAANSAAELPQNSVSRTRFRNQHCQIEPVMYCKFYIKFLIKFHRFLLFILDLKFQNIMKAIYF